LVSIDDLFLNVISTIEFGNILLVNEPALTPVLPAGQEPVLVQLIYAIRLENVISLGAY